MFHQVRQNLNDLRLPDVPVSPATTHTPTTPKRARGRSIGSARPTAPSASTPRGAATPLPLHLPVHTTTPVVTNLALRPKSPPVEPSTVSPPQTDSARLVKRVYYRYPDGTVFDADAYAALEENQLHELHLSADVPHPSQPSALGDFSPSPWTPHPSSPPHHQAPRPAPSRVATGASPADRRHPAPRSPRRTPQPIAQPPHSTVGYRRPTPTKSRPVGPGPVDIAPPTPPDPAPEPSAPKPVPRPRSRTCPTDRGAPLRARSLGPAGGGRDGAADAAEPATAPKEARPPAAGVSVFDVLYQRSVQKQLMRREVERAAEELRRRESEAIAKSCTFHPKIKHVPSNGCPDTLDVFERISADANRRRRKRDESVKQLVEKEMKGCTFKPEIDSTIPLNNQAKVVDRLVYDTQERKKKAANKLKEHLAQPGKMISKEEEKKLVGRLMEDIGKRGERLATAQSEVRREVRARNVSRAKGPDVAVRVTQRLYENKDRQNTMIELQKRTEEVFQEECTFKPQKAARPKTSSPTHSVHSLQSLRSPVSESADKQIPSLYEDTIRRFGHNYGDYKVEHSPRLAADDYSPHIDDPFVDSVHSSTESEGDQDALSDIPCLQEDDKLARGSRRGSHPPRKPPAAAEAEAAVLTDGSDLTLEESED